MRAGILPGAACTHKIVSITVLYRLAACLAASYGYRRSPTAASLPPDELMRPGEVPAPAVASCRRAQEPVARKALLVLSTPHVEVHTRRIDIRPFAACTDLASWSFLDKCGRRPCRCVLTVGTCQQTAPECTNRRADALRVGRRLAAYRAGADGYGCDSQAATP